MRCGEERAYDQSRPVTLSTDHTSQIGGTEIAFEFSSGDEASHSEGLDGRRNRLGTLSFGHVFFFAVFRRLCDRRGVTDGGENAPAGGAEAEAGQGTAPSKRGSVMRGRRAWENDVVER